MSVQYVKVTGRRKWTPNPMRYCTMLHERQDDQTMTLTEWREYVKSGRRSITYVGMMGNTAITGQIKRVTTRSVFVTLNGHQNVQQVHRADVRPR
jgi:hypothetical protein